MNRPIVMARLLSVDVFSDDTRLGCLLQNLGVVN